MLRLVLVMLSLSECLSRLCLCLHSSGLKFEGDDAVMKDALQVLRKVYSE